DPLACETPNPWSMSVIFMCGVWVLSPRKFTQPMVRTIPLAQVLGVPLRRGEGRLRASVSASLRDRTAYSSFKCSRQNRSIMPVMVVSTSAVASIGFALGRGLAGAFAGTIGLAEMGSDVTIPCRAFASLKLLFRERRMPGPKEML